MSIKKILKLRDMNYIDFKQISNLYGTTEQQNKVSIK